MSAWTVIKHVEVPSGGVSELELLNIPQTYDDLFIVVSARTDNAATSDSLTIQINGSTADQTRRRLQGNGSTVSSPTTLSFIVNGNTATANTFGNASLYIPNYRGNTNKSMSFDIVSENNATEAFQQITANLWSQTAAITDIEFVAVGSTILQYSSATIWGITKGSSGGVTVS